MASKGPRSKLEHETRAKRQKALDPPREPPRPKTHWDHVLEEMSWLAKDFESERKWKLAQAKKVALRANKGVLDQATREEKKMKEEEHRLRKIALNISKDVKKFWLKIEKLVLYKHQTALDEKRKKALDKQLEYLLGQTERYSTMLAENLVDTYREEKLSIQYKEENEIDTKRSTRLNVEPESDKKDADDDYNQCLEDELEDDEHTIEEDEAHITEKERQEELDALRNEMDMPLDELLKRYTINKDSREDDPKIDEDEAELIIVDNIKDAKYDGLSDVDEIAPHGLFSVTDRGCGDCNGRITISEKQSANARTDLSITSSETSRESDYDIGEKHYEFTEEQNDGDFVLAEGEEKDDEATLSEEEKLAKIESNDVEDEVALLQMESKLPIEELLARYKEHEKADVGSNDESEYAYACSDLESSPKRIYKFNNIHTSMGDDDEQQGEEEKLSRHLAEEGEEQFRAKSEEGRESENKIADAAAAARSAQPTGYTFSTTKVRTKLPFLLKYPLREYQHIGLDWLVTMYEKRLNGILADEMGLGKTIMTIALLAHLACEKGIWGPHLIVVPTSVMLNWETEFLKWCPAFKILTYFGSAKERKFKRQGWMKPNSFHVCVTTYRLVIQDSKVFKRKKWKYLILDEAHLIKNWKSQRWQTLLNFNSKRRILLTGTPLQNDLMELWSLMHFLMPHIFQSHQEFKDWFSNPISGMVEGQEKVNKEVIDRLHNVLRPFILRRLKRDVEKQLPMKHEHIIYCRLSRRQRTLYEDFIASSETQATLASANFFAMISVIMQLRKVCNHPDLFEGRPIVSSFDMSGLEIQISPSICSMLTPGIFSAVDLKELGFLFTHLDFSMASWVFDEVNDIATPSNLIKDRVSMDDLDAGSDFKYQKKFQGTNLFEDIRRLIVEERLKQAKERAASIAWWNSLRCRKKPVYSTTLRELVTVKYPASHNHQNKTDHSSYLHSSKLVQLVPSPVERFQRVTDLIESFMFAIPAARAPSPVCWCSRFGTTVFLQPNYQERCTKVLSPLLSPIRPAIVRRQLYFPDRRLVQFDCGKLQELSILLRQLKSDGHRALIFTQMTKMLDILEAFINLYGYTYMRLDGSTQPEERQTLMQRFNTNPKIFLFILSTRSGGVGVNLVGADTVIFYDSDWNPAMDQQAQDRCHRIGQTREVHIYRLISESTIEENILKKANQKRALDDLVIQSGGYNTDFFSKLDPMELFSGHRTLAIKNSQKDRNCSCDGRVSSVSNADVDAALKFAEDEADYMALKKVELEEAVDNQEFTEEGIGKFEDDDLLNEEDGNADEPVDQGTGIPASSRENGLISLGSDPIEERAITFSSKEDEADLVADVKQIAALSSSSGQAISSFESRLRPIDRYAIRFLELCDPIVNKAATESQARFEETDWELDRIEKFKEDLEAEIDEGEEPLVYESWDADFATEAYRQQVEVLTQHQLLEQLENEAREKQEGDGELCDSVEKKNLTDSRSKSKKKSKKAKFKSLRKGSLASDSNAAKEVSHTQPLDGNDSSPSEVDLGDGETLHSSLPRKRKKAEPVAGIEEERLNKKKSKKVKKPQHILSPSVEDHNMAVKTHGESNINADTEPRSASRSKMGGKISITLMPLKRVLTIKQEKLKKKGSVWSRECFPAPDCWLRQEDALLSAVVHEYGPNWSLLSDTLYGATAGGSYRGIYRHPVHCCERFRELIHKVIFSSPETANTEKTSNVGSGKSLLRVTEDNIRTLLDISTELPDRELIIQKHFTALLSSVWRASLSVQSGTCSGKEMKMLGSASDQISGCTAKEQRLKFNSSALGQISKLLADALRHEVSDQHNTILPSDRRENASASPERLELSVQFLGEKEDLSMHLPPVINLSIYSSDPPLPEEKITIGDHLSIQLQTSVENRFRDASRACLDDCLGWASSAFPTSDLKSRAASKSHALGKHKLAFADSSRPKAKLKRTTEPGGVHHAISEPGIPAKPPVPCDPELRFEPTLSDASDFEKTSSFLDKETVSELEDFEPVPHEYLPGFISGLDDYRLSPEYTGIG